MKYPIVGAGGGGKSGGESRVAVEAEDSLRSKQYARVIDLVSEGEIEGLVDGLKSVYLDDTVIQNEDGTYNFKDVIFTKRVGTQSQSHIRAFPTVQSENVVGVQVTNGSPVVKTITNTNADVARVTLSVPRLTSQDVTNGDINGTSVEIKIELQSNGGGYVAQKIRPNVFDLSVGGGVISSLAQEINAATIHVVWTGIAAATYQTASFRVDYRAVGSGTWIALKTKYVSGTGVKVPKTVQTEMFGVETVRVVTIFGFVQYELSAPTARRSFSFEAPTDDQYEFRVVQLTGAGSIVSAGTGNGWESTDIISGKTSSRYQRAYRIPLAGNQPWDIRVTRITADSASSALQNETWWDSYTEVVETKFEYPNSALMAISIDAERFNRIPVRSYEIQGMIVQIPSNYDPLTRVYSGAWDGLFVTAWTDNPAWCFYDMATNTRYGVGSYLLGSLPDKWALYTIAQYCDEIIDTGIGGKEPRFTCNLYLQARNDAFQVLQAMASVFKAITYWVDGAVTAVQDAPSDPVALFTPANVIDGMFNYSGSSLRTRHTVALVSWNDPEDRYRLAIEYVSDDEGIAKYGIVQTEVVAVGCTSRGQAHRFGKALLFSERLETDTVTFKAGMDGLGLQPNDVINTSDPLRAGVRVGGRIQSATINTVLLDADVVIDGVDTYTLWVTLADGTVESRNVTNVASTTSSLVVGTDFTSIPENWSMWVLSSGALNHETWRIVSLTEADDVNAEITAMQYTPGKYALIENDIELQSNATTVLMTDAPSAPTDLTIDETLFAVNKSVIATRITLSWAGNAAYYEVNYKKDDGNWVKISTSGSSIDIEPVTAGNFSFTVAGVNGLGVRSQITTTSGDILGLTAPPEDVTGFELTAVTGNAHLTWDPAIDLDVIVGGSVKFRHTPRLTGATWIDATTIGGQTSGVATTAVLPLMAGTYLIKWEDSSGNQSDNETLIVTNAPTIFNMNLADSHVEDPTFSGTKTDVLVNINDDLTLALNAGDVEPIGTYEFAGSTDLGLILTSRLSAVIVSNGVDLGDTIDTRPLMSTWANIDGEIINDVNATVYVQTSDDNITFGAWETLFAGEYYARAFNFKCVLTSDFISHNIEISELSVLVDMPDLVEGGEDIVSGAASKSVTYSEAFFSSPALGITAQDMATGDYYEITNKTTTGFDIIFKNSGGTAVSRTFDYIARGY